MSYQVLARKYRPKNFDTLVGQEHVVRALTHALQTQRLHHAYLFTGTRGVGKTTLSRILAKSFNCIGPDGQGGITAQPCGVCEVCLAIDAGRFVDYIEMDAASNRGVDEMAQLLEQAVYAPSNARFKVYMIDEVHMLTNTAFNAMLKTLEEPPPHIKFILATTDPQKIPVTVLSRCLQFNLKQMPPGHIINHLENILKLEEIEAETPALRLLAQGAHGSMRDALSLTDQAIAYAAGKVSLEAVQGMLGALDQSFLLRLLDALAQEDGPGLLAVADEMASRSLSYNNALQDLASLLHQLALAQSVPQALADDLPDREEIVRLAQLFDPQEVQLFYQIAVHGRNEIGLAPDEYAGFSMTLLRMLAFRPTAAAGQAAPPSGGNPVARGPAQAANMVARSGASAHASQAQVAPQPASAAKHQQTANVNPAISASTANKRDGLSPAMAALQAARGSAMPERAKQAQPQPAAQPIVQAAPQIPADLAPAKQINTQPDAGQLAETKQQNATLNPVTDSATKVATNATTESANTPAANPPTNPPAQPLTAEKKPVARDEDAPPWDDDDQWSHDGAAEFFGAQLEQTGRTSANSSANPSTNKRPQEFSPTRQMAQATPSLPPIATTPAETAPIQSVQRDSSKVAAIAAALKIAERGQARVAAGNGATERNTTTQQIAESASSAIEVAGKDGFNQGVAEKQEAPPFVKIAVEQLGWDGDWPELAKNLSVRGIVQQLAWQTELVSSEQNGNTTLLHLRTPLQTLGSDTNIEKLSGVLSEHFQQTVKVLVKVEGPVWHTANARAEELRLQRLQEAEQIVFADEFVQGLMSRFGGHVVADSIRPASPGLQV